MMAGFTTLRVLTAPGVLRGRGLTDVHFTDIPVPTVKISSFAQPGDTLRQALGRLTTDTVVDLEGNNYQDPDFTMGGPTGYGSSTTYTYFFQNVIGLVNGGATITPGSSTHAAAVNAQDDANTGTVQETIWRIGRGTSKATTPYLGNLTIDGSASQGHVFNGLNIYYCTNALLENVTVLGCLGSSGAPPGETFPINNYKSIRTTLRNCYVDGAMSGVASAASGLGNNNIDQILVIGSTFKNMGFGAGVTHYQSTNPTYIGCTFDKNHLVGANFEKVSGTITLVNCTFTDNSHAMCVDTDGASAVVNIYDPIWKTKYGTTGQPGTFDILRHNTYAFPPGNPSPPNKQNIADFHVFAGGTWVGGRPEDGGHYVGGTEVTSTYLKVVTN